MPLPRVAVEALSDHLRAHPASPDDLVFRSPDGEATRLSNWRHRVWEPALTAAKLGHLRPHDPRHTAVALWTAAGASPREISARAGHSSVVTVLDRYGHLLPGSEVKVNEALDAMAILAKDHTKSAPVSQIRWSGCVSLVSFSPGRPQNRTNYAL